MKRFCLKEIVIIAGILFVLSGTLYAQAGPPPTGPKGPESAFSKEDREKAFGLYGLYAAYAARQDDMSICRDSEDSGKCAQDAQFFLAILNIARGKCSAVENRLLQQLCRASQEKCSDTDDPFVGEFCSAIDQKDAQKLKRISYRPEWATAYGIMDDEDAQMIIGVYYGGRTNDAAECVAASKNVYMQNVCKVLFEPALSAMDFQKRLDEVRQSYQENSKGPAMNNSR